jgi:hypothetical protein
MATIIAVVEETVNPDPDPGVDVDAKDVDTGAADTNAIGSAAALALPCANACAYSAWA